MTYIVDRIEGDIAVCENGQTGEIVNFPIANFPEPPKEGAAFVMEDGAITYVENRSRRKIQQLMNKVWDDGQKSD